MIFWILSLMTNLRLGLHLKKTKATGPTLIGLLPFLTVGKGRGRAMQGGGIMIRTVMEAANGTSPGTRDRISGPFKEPRNRLPAWRNQFLGSINAWARTTRHRRAARDKTGKRYKGQT
jgi:hypothetical protein